MAAIFRFINKAVPLPELYPLVVPVIVGCTVGVATMYVKLRGDTDISLNHSHAMPFMTERSQKGPVLGKWVFHSQTLGGLMSALPEEYTEGWVKHNYPEYASGAAYPAHVAQS